MEQNENSAHFARKDEARMCAFLGNGKFLEKHVRIAFLCLFGFSITEELSSSKGSPKKQGKGFLFRAEPFFGRKREGGIQKEWKVKFI